MIANICEALSKRLSVSSKQLHQIQEYKPEARAWSLGLAGEQLSGSGYNAKLRYTEQEEEEEEEEKKK